MEDYDKEIIENPTKALTDKLIWCEQLIENNH